MLPLPSPPTDNLYKFLSISGILIIAFSIYYTHISSKELYQQVDKYNSANMEYNSLDEKVENENLDLKESIETYYLKYNIKHKSIINDSLILWRSIIRGSKEELADSKEIEKKIDDLARLKQERSYKKALVNEFEKNYEFVKQQNLELDEILEMMFYFGLTISVTGFLTWYFKFQKIQDNILEDQYKQLIKDTDCQSCGMYLIDVDNQSIKSDSASRNSVYCSYCYDNGGFTEPNITLNEMKEKVKLRCIELGLEKNKIQKQVNGLDNLKRWKRVFYW